MHIHLSLHDIELEGPAEVLDPFLHVYKYDQVLAKLRESAATKSLQPSGYECGGTPDTVFPNNQYGSGRLDAAKAVGLAAADGKADPCALLSLRDCIYFKDASPDLVQVLSEMPDIEEIREEKAIELAGAPQADALPQISRNLTETDVEWNIKMIGAPDVWATGNRGEGVVVGVIDTGAIATHEALRDSYRGEYGWFDPVEGKPEPVDGEGHGAHIVGTIVGSHGVGVAPGAKWMMCRGCAGRMCAERNLLACAEFMTCPTDPQGNNRDCTKAPRVINNSWGYKGDILDKSIAAWRSAGIIPVFAIGNNRPECSSAAYPAHLDNVIAVGATDNNDGLWSGSRKGPSPTGLVKPDLSAPGVAIRSVSTKSDSEYELREGTSMAAPHVVGAIALMLSAHPEYKYDQVLAKLRESAATKSLQPSGYDVFRD
ncbi:hypothetical protein ATCC90586_009023 [Pythium insidiosum]|nr:hypothetical protein ATCC90586_009023 [Pythium insidiosum]